MAQRNYEMPNKTNLNQLVSYASCIRLLYRDTYRENFGCCQNRQRENARV